MSVEAIELVGRGVGFSQTPVTTEQRNAFLEGERLRAARLAAELAVVGRLSANGRHSPARDAEVLWQAGLCPTGSILSPDYAAAPPGILEI